MNWLDSTEKLISIGTAGLAALFFITTKMIIPYFVKRKQYISNINNMIDKVNHVYSELTPNGGSSIKDNIEKIKRDLGDVYDLSVANSLKTLLLFETSSDALFECNLKGEVIWVNEAFERMWGVGQTDLLGDNWISFIHSDDISRVYTLWQETVTTMRPYKARYRIFNSTTKREVFVNATASLLRTSNGKPLSFFGKVVEVEPF